MKKGPIILLLGMVASLVWVYWESLNNGFVWDDDAFLVQSNFYSGSGAIDRAMFQPFFISLDYYRPLVVLSYVLEMNVLGVEPWHFHLVNVIFHTAISCMLFLFLYSLLKVRFAERVAIWSAFLATAFYAFHPALCEAVVWVSGRFDLMLTFFLMLALISDYHLRRSIFVRAILVFFLVACAAFSKEVAITFPAVLYCWHLFLEAYSRDSEPQDILVFFTDVFKKHFLVYASAALAVLVYVTVRVASLGYFKTQSAYSDYGDAWQHLLLIVKATAFYLTWAVFPFLEISPIHYQEMPLKPDDLVAILSLFLVLLLAFLAVFGVFRRKAEPYLLVCFVVLLLPVLFVVQIPLQYNIGQERYLQFPLVFVAVAFSLLVARAWAHAVSRRVLVFVFCGWAFVSILNIHVTIPLWRSNLSLWSWLSSTQKQCAICMVNYGSALLEVGRIKEAEDAAKAAMQIPSSYNQPLAFSYALLGNIEFINGNRKAAAEQYLKAFDTQFLRNVGLLNNMAWTLILLKEFDAALFYIHHAMKIEQESHAVYLNYGMLSLAKNNIADATFYFDKAVSFSPRHVRDSVRQLTQAYLDGRKVINFGEKGERLLESQ